jgi:hypothetical protein
MYAGFNLIDRNNHFDKYIPVGKSLFEINESQVKATLASFVDGDGNLNASKMQANWFPTLDAQIFISHSHQDKEKALGLSGWLKKEFGLVSFIDSCVWGHADDLLRMIDEEYCLSPGGATYDYQKRNRSTSHVHMMLSIALSKMMDRTECLIFLNTPSSITPESVIKGNETTQSPWIYSEIAMTRLVRRRMPTEHRMLVKADSIRMKAAVESLQFQYEVELDHLAQLSLAQLNTWHAICAKRHVTGTDTLDVLYDLHKNIS